MARTPVPNFEIRLCGSLAVIVDGQDVTASLPGRQGRLLLAYLACNRRRPVSREELIEVLWPLTSPSRPRDVLGALISKLRRALGPSMLPSRRELTLVLSPDAVIDLEVAARAAQRAQTALEAGDAELVLRLARDASEVLGRGFLLGYEEPWVQERRREVEEIRLRALECVARAGLTLAGGHLATAEVAAQALVQAEPLRERGYRLLMEVHAAQGDVAAAMQAYERLRRSLGEELGIAPGPRIRALHERLLRGGEVASARGAGGSQPSIRRSELPAGEEQPRHTEQRRRILSSKLSTPPLRAGIVERPELVERLRTADAAIVLLSAPAGYGKTTLLAQWRAHDERPFAWVSLDAGDNDPIALAAEVLAALSTVLELDDALSDALMASEPPLEDVVLPALVNACADAGFAFVLVLDDLHLVTDERSLSVVRYVADRLPPGCQLAVATRTDPPLPLGSLRAHSRLRELRTAELMLDNAEAGALLAGAGVRLADERVAQLVEKAEGWAAMIYLAALALRGRSKADEFLSRFAGTSRYVADFLAEDVLARQSNAVIEFLLRTSVLDELTGSLCDAVTAGTGGDETLHALERTNLLVVPLDEERLAYRYHYLFAGYLRAELARREPALVPELHRRAWRWYRGEGLIGRAVAHAQAAGDFDVAAELVASTWLETSEAGQVETLRSWIAGFSDAQVQAHAPLAVAAAWTSGLVGEPERAARFAAAARRGFWDGPMPDGTASLESAVAIMSGASGMRGLSHMRAAAERATQLEPIGSKWRPLALFILGIAATLQGDFAHARAALTEGVEVGPAETPIAAASLAYLALIALQEGDDKTAWDHADRAYVIIDRPAQRNYLPSICTYGVAANLLTRLGEPDRAVAAIERANALLPRLTGAYWFQMIETRIRLAPPLAALGRREEAEQRLIEAAALLEERDDTGVLPDWHAETCRRLRLQRPLKVRRLADAQRADRREPSAASRVVALAPHRAGRRTNDRP